MDHAAHFHREILAFEAAARRAVGTDEAPAVPSCPDWTMSDLVQHLGGVHRYVIRVLEERPTQALDPMDPVIYRLPEDREGWPVLGAAPNRGPLAESLIDWFADGAAALESHFRSSDPGEAVWTWSQEQTVGFWLRMQVIEAAVHRWDAERATGEPGPVDPELAADAIAQTFEVMVPAGRSRNSAPRGSGERYRFSRTDGSESWTVYFEGDDVLVTNGSELCDVEVSGTASDLMLFLWQRIPADLLEVKGDREVLDRYFTLVPRV
ncbi:maleylpyruvate isomerase family mycothiol-dependent enzyme [Streptomyces sp. NPDC002730]|uniref:maleylpyruvate isomerase family mycothiol-dependent enzyme n=1 Tax=Streptomyces sp. NPDC002730 TaxID=3364662 RepID=UPI0036C950C2